MKTVKGSYKFENSPTMFRGWSKLLINESWSFGWYNIFNFKGSPNIDRLGKTLISLPYVIEHDGDIDRFLKMNQDESCPVFLNYDKKLNALTFYNKKIYVPSFVGIEIHLLDEFIKDFLAHAHDIKTKLVAVKT